MNNFFIFYSKYNNLLKLLGLFFITSIYVTITKDFTLSMISNNINPFSIITQDGKLGFAEFLYRITIAYLIYQLIISIRQNTRRN